MVEEIGICLLPLAMVALGSIRSHVFIVFQISAAILCCCSDALCSDADSNLPDPLDRIRGSTSRELYFNKTQ